MSETFLIPVVILGLVMLLPLQRVIRGPTVFDRIIAAGLIGTDGILLLVLLGFMYERVDMFIDIAIAYALLNFISVIAASKYLEHRRQKP